METCAIIIQLEARDSTCVLDWVTALMSFCSQNLFGREVKRIAEREGSLVF